MKLLEYEAKGLLRQAGLPVPRGHVIKHFATRRGLRWPLMVKAQVPVGGRGKAGGIVQTATPTELDAAVERLLGLELLGHQVDELLIEEAAQIQRELYVAIVLDRAAQALVLLASKTGGVEINALVAESTIWRRTLAEAPSRRVAVELAAYLELAPSSYETLETILAGLWRVSAEQDAVLVEVNPLVVLKDGQLLCADAKIELDDAAAFRHPGRTFAAAPASAQFVVLDSAGAVASMANGAGLAMATVDAITAAGATAANFFDCGGGSSTAEMVAGFERIRALPSVQAIVINIFAGISRCDEVAEAILAARQADPSPLPLFVRLEGTNAEAGRTMLAEAGVATLPSLAECVAGAVSAVHHV